MPKTQLVLPLVLTTTALAGMEQYGLCLADLHEAALDAQVIPQAGHRREVRGFNAVAFVTDSTGGIVLTVFPRGSRLVRVARKDSGLSRHRPPKRRSTARTDSRRP